MSEAKQDDSGATRAPLHTDVRRGVGNMERVEYGSVAIETNIPLTPRDRIRLRASCRRLEKALDQSVRQMQREFERFIKTPEGEKLLVDAIVSRIKESA